ncbi:MAG: hypothetical protein JW862_01880 [Anaerolineales bacterium]|nr:hypothetical protein [Anaerolineales bacterium]
MNEHILGSGQRSLVVEQAGRVVSLLTLHDVKKILRVDWPNTTAAQAMIPVEKMKRILPEAELVDPLQKWITMR